MLIPLAINKGMLRPSLVNGNTLSYGWCNRAQRKGVSNIALHIQYKLESVSAFTNYSIA